MLRALLVLALLVPACATDDGGGPPDVGDASESGEVAEVLCWYCDAEGVLAQCDADGAAVRCGDDLFDVCAVGDLFDGTFECQPAGHTCDGPGSLPPACE